MTVIRLSWQALLATRVYEIRSIHMINHPLDRNIVTQGAHRSQIEQLLQCEIHFDDHEHDDVRSKKTRFISSINSTNGDCSSFGL